MVDLWDFPICVTRWSKEREEEERVKREQEAGTWAVSQHSEKELKKTLANAMHAARFNGRFFSGFHNY